MVETLSLPGPQTNAPTAYLPSIKHITTGTRDVSLQELRAYVDYLRLLYNPEVRGSRKRRPEGGAQKSTNDSRLRSRSRDQRDGRKYSNAISITAAPSIAIDSIRADAFERAYSIRWLTSLVAHADDIFLRVIHHNTISIANATNATDAETLDSVPEGTNSHRSDSCEMKEKESEETETEAKAMHEKLIGEAAALLAACAGTAGSGRVSRTYAFDLPSVDDDDDDAPSGLSDEPCRVEQEEEEERERERKRGTTSVTLTLTDAPLENGDYASVGAQTWGAACVMADMIFEDPTRFFGAFPLISNSELELKNSFTVRRRQPYRVLELGAGTGLVGLSIAKYLELSGVEAEVALTDVHPSVLTNLRSNVSTNFPGASNNSKVDVFVHSLDWSLYALSERDLDLGTFDLILGADIIYEKEHALWIRACLQRLLRPPLPHHVDQDEHQEAYFHLVIPLRRTHVLESRTVEQVFGNNSNSNIDENKFEIVCQERFSCDSYPSSSVMEPADEVEYAYFKIGWKKQS